MMKSNLFSFLYLWTITLLFLLLLPRVIHSLSNPYCVGPNTNLTFNSSETYEIHEDGCETGGWVLHDISDTWINASNVMMKHGNAVAMDIRGEISNVTIIMRNVQWVIESVKASPAIGFNKASVSNTTFELDNCTMNAYSSTANSRSIEFSASTFENFTFAATRCNFTAIAPSVASSVLYSHATTFNNTVMNFTSNFMRSISPKNAYFFILEMTDANYMKVLLTNNEMILGSPDNNLMFFGVVNKMSYGLNNSEFLIEGGTVDMESTSVDTQHANPFLQLQSAVIENSVIQFKDVEVVKWQGAALQSHYLAHLLTATNLSVTFDNVSATITKTGNQLFASQLWSSTLSNCTFLLVNSNISITADSGNVTLTRFFQSSFEDTKHIVRNCHLNLFSQSSCFVWKSWSSSFTDTSNQFAMEGDSVVNVTSVSAGTSSAAGVFYSYDDTSALVNDKGIGGYAVVEFKIQESNIFVFVNGIDGNASMFTFVHSEIFRGSKTYIFGSIVNVTGIGSNVWASNIATWYSEASYYQININTQSELNALSTGGSAANLLFKDPPSQNFGNGSIKVKKSTLTVESTIDSAVNIHYEANGNVGDMEIQIINSTLDSKAEQTASNIRGNNINAVQDVNLMASRSCIAPPCATASVCSGHASTVTGNPGKCKCVCRNSWEGTYCERCPLGYDPSEDCGVCAANYAGYPSCTTTVTQPPTLATCSSAVHCNDHASRVTGKPGTCRCTCRNQWDGVSCEICPPGYNPARDCAVCIADPAHNYFSAVSTQDEASNVLMLVSSGLERVAVNMAQSFFTVQGTDRVRNMLFSSWKGGSLTLDDSDMKATKITVSTSWISNVALSAKSPLDAGTLQNSDWKFINTNLTTFVVNASAQNILTTKLEMIDSSFVVSGCRFFSTIAEPAPSYEPRNIFWEIQAMENSVLRLQDSKFIVDSSNSGHGYNVKLFGLAANHSLIKNVSFVVSDTSMESNASTSNSRNFFLQYMSLQEGSNFSFVNDCSFWSLGYFAYNFYFYQVNITDSTLLIDSSSLTSISGPSNADAVGVYMRNNHMLRSTLTVKTVTFNTSEGSLFHSEKGGSVTDSILLFNHLESPSSQPGSVISLDDVTAQNMSLLLHQPTLWHDQKTVHWEWARARILQIYSKSVLVDSLLEIIGVSYDGEMGFNLQCQVVNSQWKFLETNLTATHTSESTANVGTMDVKHTGLTMLVQHSKWSAASTSTAGNFGFVGKAKLTDFNLTVDNTTWKVYGLNAHNLLFNDSTVTGGFFHVTNSFFQTVGTELSVNVFLNFGNYTHNEWVIEKSSKLNALSVSSSCKAVSTFGIILQAENSIAEDFAVVISDTTMAAGASKGTAPVMAFYFSTNSTLVAGKIRDVSLTINKGSTMTYSSTDMGSAYLIWFNKGYYSNVTLSLIDLSTVFVKGTSRAAWIYLSAPVENGLHFRARNVVGVANSSDAESALLALSDTATFSTPQNQVWIRLAESSIALGGSADTIENVMVGLVYSSSKQEGKLVDLHVVITESNITATGGDNSRISVLGFLATASHVRYIITESSWIVGQAIKSKYPMTMILFRGNTTNCSVTVNQGSIMFLTTTQPLKFNRESQLLRFESAQVLQDNQFYFDNAKLAIFHSFSSALIAFGGSRITGQIVDIHASNISLNSSGDAVVLNFPSEGCSVANMSVEVDSITVLSAVSVTARASFLAAEYFDGTNFTLGVHESVLLMNSTGGTGNAIFVDLFHSYLLDSLIQIISSKIVVFALGPGAALVRTSNTSIVSTGMKFLGSNTRSYAFGDTSEATIFHFQSETKVINAEIFLNTGIVTVMQKSAINQGYATVLTVESDCDFNHSSVLFNGPIEFEVDGVNSELILFDEHAQLQNRMNSSVKIHNVEMTLSAFYEAHLINFEDVQYFTVEIAGSILDITATGSSEQSTVLCITFKGKAESNTVEVTASTITLQGTQVAVLVGFVLSTLATNNNVTVTRNCVISLNSSSDLFNELPTSSVVIAYMSVLSGCRFYLQDSEIKGADARNLFNFNQSTDSKGIYRIQNVTLPSSMRYVVNVHPADPASSDFILSDSVFDFLSTNFPKLNSFGIMVPDSVAPRFSKVGFSFINCSVTFTKKRFFVLGPPEDGAAGKLHFTTSKLLSAGPASAGLWPTIMKKGLIISECSRWNGAALTEDDVRSWVDPAGVDVQVPASFNNVSCLPSATMTPTIPIVVDPTNTTVPTRTLSFPALPEEKDATKTMSLVDDNDTKNVSTTEPPNTTTAIPSTIPMTILPTEESKWCREMPKVYISQYPSLPTSLELSNSKIEIIVALVDPMTNLWIANIGPNTILVTDAVITDVDLLNATHIKVHCGPPDESGFSIHEAHVVTIRFPSTCFVCSPPSPSTNLAANLNTTINAPNGISSVEFTVIETPQPIPYVMKQTTEVVGAAAGGISGLSGTGTIATMTARASLVLALSTCDFSHTAELDPTQSPTNYRFGPKQGAYYRGAIVANIFMIAIFAGLNILGGVVWFLIFKDYRIRGLYGLDLAIKRVHFPGLMIVPFAVLVPGLSMSAVAIYIHGTDDPLDPVMATMALALCVVFQIYFAFHVLYGFDCVFVLEEDFDEAGELKERNAVLKFFHGTHHWVDRHYKIGYKSMYLPLFGDFYFGTQWYVILDIGVTFLSGLIDGVRPDSLIGCRNISILVMIINFAVLLLSLFYRPFHSQFNTIHFGLNSSMIFLASLLLVLSQATDNEHLLTGATLISSFSIYVALVKSVTDTLIGIQKLKWKDWAEKVREKMRREGKNVQGGVDEPLLSVVNDESASETAKRERDPKEPIAPTTRGENMPFNEWDVNENDLEEMEQLSDEGGGLRADIDPLLGGIRPRISTSKTEEAQRIYEEIQRGLTGSSEKQELSVTGGQNAPSLLLPLDFAEELL